MLRKFANDNIENVGGGNGWGDINGEPCYFDEHGHLQTNVWKEGDDGNLYYLGSDGTPVRGLQIIKDVCYYFDENGSV